MNVLKIKSAEEIKETACSEDVSLAKILETYNLTFDDIGLFFIDKNIINRNDDGKTYPVNIFYSLRKEEIYQLKVDFTHERIREAIKQDKSGLSIKAS